MVDGALDRETVERWYRDIAPRIAGKPARVRLDLRGVPAMDSAGAALCGVIRRRVEAAGGRLVLVGASDAARDSLSVFRLRLEEEAPRPERGRFERLGEAAYARFEGLVLFAVLVTDTFHHTVTTILRGRKGMRKGAIIEQMVRIGLESLGIVGLIALLVGLTVALQSAAQLRQFGANVYIVDLVGISMTREMGPLMTAIIVAGRSGSSISAELATMVITDEVDALRAMGVQPARFLVVPRFVGITLTQPLLTVMANLLGILGGFIIGLTYLDLGADTFFNRLMETLALKDLLTGLVKSVSFAWIIVFIGAHRGFRVTGGAEGVGIATTSSVVQSIFAVIVADAFFSLIFYFD
ncbi:MAG: MlaE family lipid ABC transporter permease subunit [Myxococcota bacterium]